MAAKSPVDQRSDLQLIRTILDPAVADNPLEFVRFVFPWGKENTPLARVRGPRTWQIDELLAIKDFIDNGRKSLLNGKLPPVYRAAVAAGRGIGKSALTTWIVWWMMSTRLGSTTIVTANTEAQLKSKTWAELSIWQSLALNSHWFERGALSLQPAPWFREVLGKPPIKKDNAYYYAQAQLWSEDNPHAFAGAHNVDGEMYIFDEASGIPESIWSVTEGVYTEQILDRYFLAFGNPRLNTGAFFQCFHEGRDLWRNRQIDARTVEGTDTAHLQSIIDRKGADSYEACVEVYGRFPAQGEKQFINMTVIADAVARDLAQDDHAALMMGVDIARYGDDSTVVRWRQGRNARVIPPTVIKSLDNMQVAYRVAELIDKYHPDAVCIDAGNGTGVIDRLRDMKYKVHEVWFGSSSPESEYANFRTFMWAAMRDWLKGGCIDDNKDLRQDLAGPEYKFMSNGDKIALEPKEQMKARSLHSPDHGDALALTFAVKVQRRDRRPGWAGNGSNRSTMARNVDAPIFS